MELSLHKCFLLTPLFQGMSRAELTQLMGQTKMNFHKFAKGRAIRQENDTCDLLMFLIYGEMDAITYADDHSYSVEEHLRAPYTLQLEHFFGLTQRYTRTFVAHTPCQFVSMTKNEVLRLTDDFIILRLNLINILAAAAQKAQRLPWRHKPDGLRGQIVRFFEERCTHPTGAKTVRIKITQLATELRESRLQVSHELNRMQDEGLLSFTRGIITIPSLERLRG